MTITLQPSVLQWARVRAGLSEEALAEKFGKRESVKWLEKITKWEDDGELTYRQAEKLAHHTHTSFGYLFLDSPPDEKLPIPDFRTAGSEAVQQLSPNLLDVIYQSQRRQDWYRDYSQEQGGEALDFVGSFPPGQPVSAAAMSIRETLAFRPSESTQSQLQPVLKEFAEAAEAAGVLVVRAGKVGNNTRRLLDPQEFRGFALVDDWAPLVFVNSADTKAAQIFTLAHELAHVWAGESALSNLQNTYAPEQKLEQFCNAVAAEYLVPLEELNNQVNRLGLTGEELINQLRRYYRVSDLVIIRRLHDAGHLSKARFKRQYEEKLEGYQAQGSSGQGNFHNNQPSQVGRRFGTALVASTLEGRTLYRDALSLLDMKKESSFREFARKLSFPL